MLPSKVMSWGARTREGKRAIRSPGSPAAERAAQRKITRNHHLPPRSRSTSPSFAEAILHTHQLTVDISRLTVLAVLSSNFRLPTSHFRLFNGQHLRQALPHLHLG